MPDKTDKKKSVAGVLLSLDISSYLDEVRCNIPSIILGIEGSSGIEFAEKRFLYSLDSNIVPSRDVFFQYYQHSPADKKDKVSVISKTVWALWKDQPERIWRLLHYWSQQNEVVKNAANKIIEHGIDNGYITPDTAFNRLWEWLLSDEMENQEAASGLLPAIPSYYLFETSELWATLSKDERQKKLSVMLTQLFIIDTKQTLKILASWAVKYPGAFDGVIEKTLVSIPTLNEQTPEYYRSLDTQLRLFKEKFDKQSPVWLAADKLCQEARKLRSKTINCKKRVGHGTQFSKNNKSHLSTKSNRRRMP